MHIDHTNDDNTRNTTPVHDIIVHVTISGYLHYNDIQNTLTTATHRIDHHYIPCMDDLILCTIIDRLTDYYICDIHTYVRGYLPVTAFNGATKRHKPQCHTGDILYCRVKDIQMNSTSYIELTCVDTTVSYDWMSAECILGKLQNGYIIGKENELSVSYTRQLYYASSNSSDDTITNSTTVTTQKQKNRTTSRSSNILEWLGERVGYEICIGMNGMIWLDTSSPTHTIILANLLIRTQWMSKKQQKQEVEKFFKKTLNT
jgi:exosome complex component RRP40